MAKPLQAREHRRPCPNELLMPGNEVEQVWDCLCRWRGWVRW